MHLVVHSHFDVSEKKCVKIIYYQFDAIRKESVSYFLAYLF
jgi:hypothetical protein